MKIYADLYGDIKKARDKKPSQLTNMKTMKETLPSSNVFDDLASNALSEALELSKNQGLADNLGLKQSIGGDTIGKGTHLY